MLDEVVRDLDETPIRDAADLERRAGGIAMFERLHGLIRGVPQLDAVTIIGRDGRLLNFSRFFPIPAVNVADRDYFRALSQSPGRPTFLSAPVQNRTTGTWTIYLAQRLDDADGQFAGLVLGAVALDYFENFYEAIKFNRGGAIGLWREDGVLLARFPASAEIGRQSQSSLRFDGLLPGMQRVDMSSQNTDGRQRVVVATRLTTQPVLVAVGRRVDDILADWRTDSAVTGMAAALCVLAIPAGMWLLVRQVRAYHALADAVRARDAAEAARRRAEEHVLQSQKLEAIGQVAAGVAHDFNNLLMVVSNQAEVFEGFAADDGPARRSAATIRRAVQQGARLTQQMLAFSRQQMLSPEAIDLNALLSATEDLLRSSLGGRARLELVLADDLWPVLADGGQLENALLNLVINARDAMPDGGRLTIATGNRHFGPDDSRGQLAPGDYVQVSVADTGSGMADQVLARAFEPFFSTKPRGQGTGLGLSQVVGFVRQSNGDVAIDTREGCGTTIHIRLPRHAGVVQAAAAEAAPLTESDLPAAAPAAPAGGPPVVLVVDDDEQVREIVVSMLQALELAVVQASSGAEGLRLLAATPEVALVVTDYAMPGMTGAEFARRLRITHPAIAVAFVTGYAQPEALEGERWILQKPFQMNGLRRILREALPMVTT